MPWYTGIGEFFRGESWQLALGFTVLTILCVGCVYVVRKTFTQPANSNFKFLLLLFFLFGIGLAAYFTPGDVMGGDGHSHLGRSWLYEDVLEKEQRFPIWTNRWYFGYPADLYYGFLFYLVTGFVSLITPLNIFESTKILLWTFHVLSGIAMYVYFRMITQPHLSSIFASIFYVFSFQHIGLVLLSGFLPLALIFLLLPVFFIICELYYTSRLSLLSASISAAIVLALMIFTHAQYGVYAIFAGCLCVCLRLYFTKTLLSKAKFLFLTLLFFSLWTFWFVLPFLLEKQELVLSSSLAADLFGRISQDRFDQLGTMLLWSRMKMYWHFYYIGISLLAFALFGTFNKGSDPAFRTLRAFFVLSSIVILVNARFIQVWFFFLCLMAGYGVLRFQTYIRNKKIWNEKLAFSIVALIVMMDIGPTLLQFPFRHFDNSRVSEIEKKLNSVHESGRIMVLIKNRDTLWRNLDVIGNDSSSPFGGIPQCSTKTHPYAVTLASKAAREILDNNGNLSQTTYDTLRFFNISYVDVPAMKKTIRITGANPAWFSTRVVKDGGKSLVLEKETWSSIRPKFDERTLDYSVIDRMMAQMQLNASMPTMALILLHPSDSVQEVSRLKSNGPSEQKPEFVITETSELHSSFRMKYRSSSDGYVNLSYSYFPWNHVEIDGTRIPAIRSAFNFIVVPVPKGEHTLTLKAGISDLREVLLYVAIGSTLVLAAGLIMMKLRARPQTRQIDRKAPLW
jgi:hypothetical protein